MLIGIFLVICKTINWITNRCNLIWIVWISNQTLNTLYLLQKAEAATKIRGTQTFFFSPLKIKKMDFAYAAFEFYKIQSSYTNSTGTHYKCTECILLQHSKKCFFYFYKMMTSLPPPPPCSYVSHFIFKVKMMTILPRAEGFCFSLNLWLNSVPFPPVKITTKWSTCLLNPVC